MPQGNVEIAIPYWADRHLSFIDVSPALRSAEEATVGVDLISSLRASSSRKLPR
jgi:hypothetical protein